MRGQGADQYSLPHLQSGGRPRSDKRDYQSVQQWHHSVHYLPRSVAHSHADGCGPEEAEGDHQLRALALIIVFEEVYHHKVSGQKQKDPLHLAHRQRPNSNV